MTEAAVGARLRTARDTLIVVMALLWGTYEVLHEGRPAVLIFIAGVLGTPIVMRVDDVTKLGGKRDQAESDS